MPVVEFERRTSLFDWANTFHALDSAATVIGRVIVSEIIIVMLFKKVEAPV
jgi:hypothetical protein